MTPCRFRIAGRIVESALPLHGLPLLPAAGAPAELYIRPARPAEAPPETPVLPGFAVPEAGRYWLADAATLVVEAAPGADPRLVQLFTLGSGLGLLLLAQGFGLLHGAALEIGGACIIGTGASGVGKSTLAATALTLGLPVLADDMIVIDPQGRAWPGLPRLKIWPDAATRLGLDLEGCVRIRPEATKVSLPLAEYMSDGPRPIAAIYEITIAPGPLTVRPLSGMRRFALLMENVYNPGLLRAERPRQQGFATFRDLAGRARFARLSRPGTGCPADRILARMIADQPAPDGARPALTTAQGPAP